MEFKEQALLMDKQIRTAQIETFGVNYRELRRELASLGFKKRGGSSEFARLSLSEVEREIDLPGVQHINFWLSPAVTSSRDVRNSLTLRIEGNPIREQREYFQGNKALWDSSRDEAYRYKETNYIYPDLIRGECDLSCLERDNHELDFKYGDIISSVGEYLSRNTGISSSIFRFRNFSFVYGEFAKDLFFEGPNGAFGVLKDIQRWFLSSAGDVYPDALWQSAAYIHQSPFGYGSSFVLRFDGDKEKRIPPGRVKIYQKTLNHIRVEISLTGDSLKDYFGIKAMNGGREGGKFFHPSRYTRNGLTISDVINGPVKRLLDYTDIISVLRYDIERSSSSEALGAFLGLYDIPSDERLMWVKLNNGLLLRKEEIPERIIKANRNGKSRWYKSLEAVRAGGGYWYRLRK